jgi:hypothetical protein
VKLEETETEYILTIRGFEGDTADLIQPLVEDLDPDKPMYIDLSCNTGGLLIDMMETLGYFTNSYTLGYIRHLSGYIIQEQVNTSHWNTLENPIYVYVNEGTFSAANLFASILSEQTDAIIIGHQTAGGASTRSTALLPNNMILNYSSEFTFLDIERHTIEYGVTPFFVFDGGDFNTVPDLIETTLDGYYNITVTDTSTLDRLSIQAVLTDISDEVDDVYMKLTIYDEVTGNVLRYSYNYNESLTTVMDIPGNSTSIRIELTLIFVKGNTQVQHVVYTNIITE